MEFDLLLLQKILVALGLGTLVGLEREHAMKETSGLRFAGLRTFALFGMLGAIAFLFLREPPALFVTVTAGIFSIIIAGYILSSLTTKTTGATTELAAVSVYFIGLLAGKGEFFAATVITLIVLSILHFKNPLHRLAHRMNKQELTSTVEFMIVAFVILPLLPNTAYGPYEAFNPYLIWLMVVFISGISFAGYFAVKLLGEKRGIGLTGFLGGFASSTALTLSFSHESREHRDNINPFVFAIGIASSAMFFRMMIEIAVLNPSLLKATFLPLLVMGLLGTALSMFFWTRKETAGTQELATRATRIKSPFTLRPALTFGLFFALILFFSKIALLKFGSEGVYLTTFISSLLDVDAITVSISNLAAHEIPQEIAARSILLAAATNTMMKGVLFTIFGNREVAKKLWLLFGITIGAGILALMV